MSVPPAEASATVPFPAGPIGVCRGCGVAVRGDDIDTDRIIPARFLKCVTFEGLATGTFADDRAEQEGRHPFDRPAHRDARLLVVNRNFGCGSSREHAPQALMRWGIRALIGESFAEIFFGNCLALGLPCLTAAPEVVDALQEAIAADPSAPLEVDLETLRVRLPDGGSRPLHLPEGARRMLLSGRWDGTSQLLLHDAELSATAARLPYLHSFPAG
jgi:3-isopropylmalate/(R)-2-methylmalate dehydratase small subunit